MDAVPFSQYKENVKHRQGLIPLTFYHVDYTRNMTGFPMHWHEEMEISLVRSGSGQYRIDTQNYTLEKDDLIIISPKTLHSGGTYDQKMSTDSFVFHTGFLCSNIPESTTINYFNPIIDGKIVFKPVIQNGHPGFKELKQCFLRLRSCHFKKEPFYELELKENLIRFFFLLFKYNCILEQKTTSVIDENEEKTRFILTYISEHYDEEITIDQLAKLSGFSACHFMNTFKKYVGVSCNKYINHFRLDKAARLLAETNESIMNIAVGIGYNNISYFNRAFKNYYGTTPKDYRRLSVPKK